MIFYVPAKVQKAKSVSNRGAQLQIERNVFARSWKKVERDAKKKKKKKKEKEKGHRRWRRLYAVHSSRGSSKSFETRTAIRNFAERDSHA